MPEVILQTKLNIPPLRPSLVERTHLINKLNEGLLAEGGADAIQLFNQKLTLISAPAGFGKTTLGQQLDSTTRWANGLAFFR